MQNQNSAIIMEGKQWDTESSGEACGRARKSTYFPCTLPDV